MKTPQAAWLRKARPPGPAWSEHPGALGQAGQQGLQRTQFGLWCPSKGVQTLHPERRPQTVEPQVIALP
jgi:hypothetical protein